VHVWRVEFDDRARRELRKLDAKIQQTILRYLRERIAVAADPRRFGKPLRRNLAGLWRYRVEDYRLICRIEDDFIVVVVLQIGHRRDVYDD
jgi:mRNA interferase RelE/StbE